MGDSVFRYCVSLTSVTIGDGVESIGSNVFYRCKCLTSIVVSENNSYYKSIGGNLYSKDGKTLIRYAVGKTDVHFTIPDSVTSINDCAFEDCTSLVSVTIGNGVETIGRSAFASCSNLTSIAIPDGVTSMGSLVFFDCAALAIVTIGDGVEIINSNAFRNCTALISVTIGNSVKTIGGSAFQYCPNLASVKIPDSVTAIGERAFLGCKNLTIYCEAENRPVDWVSDWNSGSPVVWGTLANGTTEEGFKWANTKDGVLIVGYNGNKTELSIPKEINGVPVTSIFERAFYNCTSLTSVTIPDSVTEIGKEAFQGCASIAYNEYDNAYYLGNENNPYVVLMNAKSTDITSCEIYNDTKIIYDGAFENCDILTSVTIPDGVISIGKNAFRNCNSLKRVTIGNSVETIGDWAFSGCTSLTSVFYRGAEEEWNKICLYGNLTEARIYYFSAEEPTEKGKFWYYDSDGNIDLW